MELNQLLHFKMIAECKTMTEACGMPAYFPAGLEQLPEELEEELGGSV